MSTFTIDTVIPTSARASVRTCINSQAGFEAWRVSPNGGQDTPTRMLSKAQWVSAASALGVGDQVMTIIRTAAPDRPGMPEEGAFSAALASDDPRPVELTGTPVLDILAPFVHPDLVSRVAVALAPIVKAANKPPQTVTVEKIVEREVQVEVSAAGTVVRKIAPGASQVEVSTLGKVFGIRGKRSQVPVSLWNAQDAPQSNPYYVIDAELVAKAVTAIERGRNIWLAGPASTGKTSLPEEIAAKTLRPFLRLAFQRTTEPTDIIGSEGLDGAGGMKWRDGALTQAIRRPGTIILLDEITYAPPGITASLQTLLDNRKMTINATGEVVHCAKGVVFLVADNTRGYGDETGRYAGTMQMNAALVDRMARMIVVDYLDKKAEAQALANHTQCSRPAADRVVGFVGMARALPGFGDVVLGLRRMISFVEMVQDGFEPADAFSDTFLTRLPDAEREALRQCYRAQFDAPSFEAELFGRVAPAAPSSDPAQVAARAAFEVDPNV